MGTNQRYWSNHTNLLISLKWVVGACRFYYPFRLVFMNNQIQALLTERDGYERRGLPDRVALINAQLRLLGFEAESASVQPPVEKAVRSKPRVHTVVDE